jgi:meiotically up-regulated gene 157 (Mug157) protein
MMSTALAAVLISCGAAGAADIAAIYPHAVEINAGLFFRTSDRTTYVSTGDIDAMWLRDSSVQAMSLLHERDLIRGVIARQERLIAIDPYANAFRRDYAVAERKFELDSLCYPVRLAQKYVKATGDHSIYDAHFYAELHVILRTILVEQHHQEQSRYHSNEHPINERFGLVWSAYRPSDDPQVYNFNIPENMFAATTLRTMADVFQNSYHDLASARKALAAADQISAAIDKKAIFWSRKHGWIYAYEIDGFGHAKFMDDANVPSLLSIPLITHEYNRKVFADTRAFVLSPGNPYFFRGRYARGVGSAHTPPNYVWPMSLIVEYRTAGPRERQRIVQELALSNAGDGALHESFDVNDPRRFTRPKFGWVNALFQQTFLSQQM